MAPPTSAGFAVRLSRGRGGITSRRVFLWYRHSCLCSGKESRRGTLICQSRISAFAGRNRVPHPWSLRVRVLTFACEPAREPL